MSVLVPIRYPLAEQSIRTLEYATSLSCDVDTDVVVLHVNLYHASGSASRAEIRRAIQPIAGGTEYSVLIRSGFLLEEVILEEGSQADVDHIVVGEKQTPKWRRILSRLTGNSPDIPTHLQEHATATVHTVNRSRQYDGDRPSRSPI